MQKSYINLGCGTVILPCAKPQHHSLLDDELYVYPLWENVDRNAGEGVDRVVDLFRYPWPLESNAYDGALLSHICEHIPHEIRINEGAIDTLIHRKFADKASDERLFYFNEMQSRCNELANLQDGWFAFFAELYRILTPGARVHILSPYAWTHAAHSDPTHTRYLNEAVFTHSMMPDNNVPAFHYETGGIQFQVVRPPVYNVMPKWMHLIDKPEELHDALHTHLNVVYDFAIEMECIK